jgi:hypothetical protein
VRRPAVLVVLLLAGCAHPVGPARTYGAYEGKARTTLEGALSNVQTVRLAVDALERGSSFGPYTSSVVSDAEESLDKLQGTFDSIQPPDRRADGLRAGVDALLRDALDDVSAVRIAVRRSDRPDLGDLAVRAAELQAWLEQHA